jgi:hypothetical protein
MVVVIANGLEFGDGFIALDLDAGAAGAVDVGLTNGRRIHAEQGDELFQTSALAGRTGGRASFQNQRLELLAAIQAFEVV